MSWGAPVAFRAVLVGGGDGAMREAVALAGGELTAELGWGEPVLAGPDTLLLLDAAGTDWTGLADELEAVAARADVVACDFAQLDAVGGTLLLTDAQLLCEPSMADRIAALAVAAGLASADAAPAVREGEAERLRRFSGEVGRIAQVLTRLAADEGAGVAEHRPSFDAGPATAPDPDPRAIRAAIRARRLRDQFFGPGLFEDPAWDMALDLFAAELEGGRVSVSSLCIAAAVAPTTALRWITRLVEQGLFERRPDPADRRRAFIALSPDGSAAMRAHLAALARTGLAIG